MSIKPLDTANRVGSIGSVDTAAPSRPFSLNTPTAVGGSGAMGVPGSSVVSASVTGLGSGGYTPTPGPYQGGSLGQMQADLDRQRMENAAMLQQQQMGGGAGLNTGGGMDGSLMRMQKEMVKAQAENAKLMEVQVSMQRENQVFSTVSNVLKVRHDTVKNTIQNVR